MQDAWRWCRSKSKWEIPGEREWSLTKGKSMIRKTTWFLVAIGVAAAMLGQTTAGTSPKALVAVTQTPDNPATQPIIMSEPHRQKQHEDLVKEVAKRKGKVDLVFMGDSITQGWSSNGQEVWK